MDNNGEVATKLEYAKAADDGESIPIVVQPLLDEIVETGISYGFEVIFAGGTARRMVLGGNPLEPDADLDIIVSPLDDKTLSLWERSLSLKAVLENLTNTWVDLLNFDGNKWYPLYDKFKTSNSPSMNRLLISKLQDNQWYITDFQGGSHLKNIRERKIKLVETDPEYFQCDLRDALNFVRLVLEFPEIEIDPGSMKLVGKFIRDGMVNFQGEQITFTEYMNKFFKVQEDIDPGMINIPRNPFLSLFSIFIHARQVNQVVPFLKQAGLKETLEQFVDLDKAEKIVMEKRARRESISHVDFDHTFKNLQNPGFLKNQWTGLFQSKEEFQDFLVAELKESFKGNETLLIQYIRQFADDFLWDLIPNFNQTVLVNRIAILNNTLRIFQTHLLSDLLTEGWYHKTAFFFTEDINQFIVQNNIQIREKINTGKYPNFLDYFYKNGGVNITRQAQCPSSTI